MEYSESSVKLAVERELTIITPEDYKLSQNYPNPFNPTTTIQYTLPMRDKITVTVYNMLGQEISFAKKANIITLVKLSNGQIEKRIFKK